MIKGLIFKQGLNGYKHENTNDRKITADKKGALNAIDVKLFQADKTTELTSTDCDGNKDGTSENSEKTNCVDGAFSCVTVGAGPFECTGKYYPPFGATGDFSIWYQVIVQDQAWLIPFPKAAALVKKRLS